MTMNRGTARQQRGLAQRGVEMMMRGRVASRTGFGGVPTLARFFHFIQARDRGDNYRDQMSG